MVDFPNLSFPQPLTQAEIAEIQISKQWERIIAALTDYQADVPKNESMSLSMPDDPSFHVEKMRRDGEIAILDGIDEGQNDVRVIQHITRLQLRIVAVPKSEPDARGKFGFIESAEDDNPSPST